MKFTKIATIVALLAGATAVQAVTSTGTFNVALKVRPICRAVVVSTGQGGAITAESQIASMTGADIDFGAHDADELNGAINGSNKGGTTAGIAVRCSKKTNYTLALTPANGNAGGAGSMAGITSGNADTISYQFYQPTVSGAGVPGAPATTTAWGNITGVGANVLALQGKGLGAAGQTVVPVYATVPANSLDVTPDVYQDHVTVTLEW